MGHHHLILALLCDARRLVGSEAHCEKENVGRDLDATLIGMLRDMRGENSNSRKPRGAKVPAGRPILPRNVAASSNDGATCSGYGDMKSDTSDSGSCSDDDECGICGASFASYQGPDWVQCTSCKRWTCGKCNWGTDDIFFVCSKC